MTKATLCTFVAMLVLASVVLLAIGQPDFSAQAETDEGFEVACLSGGAPPPLCFPAPCPDKKDRRKGKNEVSHL